MLEDIFKDGVLLYLAKPWLLPIAASYLPPIHQDHLAAGLSVAFSKLAKQGIQPIKFFMHDDE